MKRLLHLALTILIFTLLASCSEDRKVNLLTSGTEISVSSSDTLLVSIFNWAKKTAAGYVGNDNDPVGPWYEAALPGREAFCIRDVSHQCISAEILGYSRQNLNMFRKFVENISESRDYCSYWEINRHNLPAPVDYSSDNDFWYNLNANFDIIDACFKLYQWTGDTTYIFDRSFDNFFRLTLNQYIDRWQLQPDRIMSRPPMMNLKPQTVKYRYSRGIPSYDESQDDLVVSSDLLGLICNGFRRYSEILGMKGADFTSKEYFARYEEYLKLIENTWWDNEKGGYHGFYKTNKKFSEGGVSNSGFLLWYGIISDTARIGKSLRDLKNSQVEVLSYMPALFYRYGFNDLAYNYLKKIYTDKRRMYPEASAGVIEGIVEGLMGIDPLAGSNSIITIPQFTGEQKWVQVDNIPVFSGLISVRHHSNITTTFANKSGRVLRWIPFFYGNYQYLRVGKNLIEASHGMDEMGNFCSYIDVKVKPGEQMTAKAEKVIE
jgi:hypothetical protein